MNLDGAVCVVTGGGGGIGAGLARALVQRGASGVMVSDLDEDAARSVADEIGGVSRVCDVSNPAHIEAVIADTMERFGRIDVMCSNAGILRLDERGGTAASCPDDDWDLSWQVNVMAHVRFARLVIPIMQKQGGGHFLITVSAAGLLNIIGAAPYGVTKHAALGFAESLSMTHGDDRIGVSALCPQAVETAMIHQSEGPNVAALDGIKTTEEVARITLDAIERNDFLVLPHDEVLGYFQGKAENYPRWLGGMRKLRRYFNSLNE